MSLNGLGTVWRNCNYNFISLDAPTKECDNCVCAEFINMFQFGLHKIRICIALHRLNDYEQH